MKFYRHSVVTVLTFREGSGYPVNQTEYRVRSLGRGRWFVECEDGWHAVLRTAELQRYFRPHVYEDGYHSSGEPVIAYEEVQILKA